MDNDSRSGTVEAGQPGAKVAAAEDEGGAPVEATPSLERRAFLGKAAVGAAAGMLAASCGGEQEGGGGGGAPAVVTNPNVRWRLASSYPRTVDAIFDTATRASESLAAMTDGRFQLRVYEANELVPAFEVMDAVQQGTVQVGHSPSYYYTGKAPVLAFDTCVALRPQRAPAARLAVRRGAGSSSCARSSRTSTSCPSRRATPARRWGAGSGARSTRPRT